MEDVHPRGPDESVTATEAVPPLRSRRAAGLFSVALLGLVLSPLFQHCRDEPRDDFPLSYFPMFSQLRGDDLEVTHFIGITGSGERRIVPLRYVGVRGLNTGRKQLSRAVKSGGAPSACKRVAESVRESPDPTMRDVVSVRVVTGTYDYERFFAGEVVPTREVTHAECDVAR